MTWQPGASASWATCACPGISWNLGRNAQLYAFAQLPVHRHVNGVQLTADWSALAGVSWRF